MRAVIPTAASDLTMPPPSAAPPAADDQDSELAEVRQQLESVSSAAGEARRAAWQTRHQMRTAMKLVETLLDPSITVESATRAGAELLGQALRAGCAVHLLSADRQVLRRFASWHSNPELLAELNSVGFADRPAATPQARIVLASGAAVLGDISTASEAVRRHALQMPVQPHSYIVAPLIGEGATMGTVTVVRIQAPEAFTNDDVEFVTCLAAQISMAIRRAGFRP